MVIAKKTRREQLHWFGKEVERAFWIDKVGPADGFKLQAEEFVLDLIGHVGSLEGIYYEKKKEEDEHGCSSRVQGPVAAIWL